jgi:hypothetical protein
VERAARGCWWRSINGAGINSHVPIGWRALASSMSMVALIAWNGVMICPPLTG